MQLDPEIWFYLGSKDEVNSGRERRLKICSYKKTISENKKIENINYIKYKIYLIPPFSKLAIPKLYFFLLP